MMHLAQEIWDVIVQDLPSFTAKSAAKVFHFNLGNRKQASHGGVWKLVFRNQAWADKALNAGLNPKLISSGLKALYDQRFYKPAYICICPNGWSPSFLASQENRSLFFQCLQPHTGEQSSSEVIVKNGITLNFSALFNEDAATVYVKPTKVLSERSGIVLHTYVMFWDDKAYNLRELDSTSWDVTMGAGMKPREDWSTWFKSTLRVTNPDDSQRMVILLEKETAERHDEEAKEMYKNIPIIQEKLSTLMQRLEED